MPEVNSWLTWAILSAVFAALTAIFAKVGVQDINSTAATFIRTIVITILLACIVFEQDAMPPLRSISLRTYFFLAFSAVATGASWVCYFRALQIGDTARVVSIDKLSVILVAIFGVLLLGERLSWLNWMGIVVTAVGLVMVALA